MSTDKRIAYGMICTWWDGIDKVGHTEPSASGHRLPCCPHCSGMLFEADSEEQWFASIARHERAGNEGYGDLMTWARGKCFPNMEALREAYAQREGAADDPS